MEALSLLIKPASGCCNMRCSYCFYSDVTNIRAVKNRGFMTLETLETIVRKALHEAGKHCMIGFQGGEPTLAGLDFFRNLIEFEKKHNINNVQITHTLQTNGLMLDGSWAEFFRENKFLIGLSIDASKQIHNSFRPDAQGKGTHNRSIQAAQLLTKSKVEFNILSVVTRQFARHPESAYRFYKQNKFRFIQFIPCLDGLSGQQGASYYSLDAVSYGKFLCSIFDQWYTDIERNDYYSIRAFDNYVRMLAGQPAESCSMKGVCTAYALIEADGSVYPCDFYAIDEYLLGNVNTHDFEEMLTGCKAERFISPSRQIDPTCASCEYHFICKGGCRRDREPVKNGVPLLNRYCEAYKLFFSYALPRLKAISLRLGYN